MTLGLLLLLDMTRVVVLLLPCLRSDLSSVHLRPSREFLEEFLEEFQVEFQVVCQEFQVVCQVFLEEFLEEFLLVLHPSHLQASLNRISLLVLP